MATWFRIIFGYILQGTFIRHLILNFQWQVDHLFLWLLVVTTLNLEKYTVRQQMVSQDWQTNRVPSCHNYLRLEHCLRSSQYVSGEVEV